MTNNALRNMRRTPYQTAASLMVMVLTFFLLQLFLVALYGSDRVLRYFESIPKISAYFKIDTKVEDVDGVKQKLEQTGKVATIRFLSQEDALKIYNERFKDEPQLTEFVQKDIFPMSLDIKTNKAADLDEIAGILKNTESVDRVTFLKDDIAALLRWTQTVRLFGLAITSYAILTSIFTIVIVISMKIATKKEEMEILTLLGATPWYIKRPFLFEGIFQGMIGAFVAFLFGVGPFLYFQKPISDFFKAEDFTVFPNVPLFLLALLGMMVLVGVLVGTIGSFIALSRYQKN